MAKRLCRLILIMLLLLLPAGVAMAGGVAAPVTARFENYCLDDAIVILTQTAGVSRIICGPVGGSFTRTFDNMPLSQALEQIARENQLIVSLKADLVVVRPAAKLPQSAYASCSLVKLPVADVLKAVAEAYGLQLAVRGQLKGEVSDELGGTMKEVLDALSAKYDFRWSVSRSTARVTAVQAK
ncbi:MAG: hypothetical protein P4N41_25205 [Negativicutes bacterium]|nr:hypothetical protein [Negativicutes bacterium]